MKVVSDEKKSGKKGAAVKTAVSSGTNKKAVKKTVSASADVKKSAAGKNVAPAKTVKTVAVKAEKAPAKAVKKTAVKTVKTVAVKAEKAPAKVVKTAAKKAVAAKVEKAPVKAVKAVAEKAPAKAEKAPAKVVKTAAKKAVAVSKAAVAAKRPELHIKKVKLSKADKKFFRDLLMKERAKFGQLLKFHADEALTSRKDSGAGRAGMATHMADLGSDNFRHDFELGLLSGEADVMEMIDEALQKLEDSEFGVCLDCGQMIPRARLEAKPYARYCTKCKSLRENTEDGFRRR